VVDRNAPHRAIIEVEANIPIIANDGLGPGAFPQPGWDIGDELEAIALDLPVQRQAPEEDGRLPDWLLRQ
jgi:hypothetical protein